MNRAQNAPQQAKMIPNLGLKHRNTFGFDANAELAYEITAPEQIPPLMQVISEKKLAWQVLGGGSNVILPSALPGATLLMNIVGQEIISTDEEAVFLAVGGGVNWHEFSPHSWNRWGSTDSKYWCIWR